MTRHLTTIAISENIKGDITKLTVKNKENTTKQKGLTNNDEKYNMKNITHPFFKQVKLRLQRPAAR